MSIDNDLLLSVTGGMAEAPVAAGVPRHGDKIGDLRVVRALRRGSTGWVYLGHNIKNNTPVAVEILSPECSGDTDLIFREKARKHAVLNHPNIIRVHKVGTWEGSQPYVAMEYVDGPSLSDLLLRNGSFPPRVALAVGFQLCRALQQVWKVNAESESIEPPGNHRVPMPEDILFTPTGELKLSVLGPGRARSLMTCADHGYIPAVYSYMSPEQHDGDSAPIDQRSDIYSVGVMLFEMIAGTRPFPEESIGSMIRAKKRKQYPDIHHRTPELPDSIPTIIERALKADPEKRWQRLGALSMALSASLRDMTSSSPIHVVGGYLKESPAKSDGSSRRKKSVFFSGSLAAIIGLIALVVLFFVLRNLSIYNEDGGGDSRAVLNESQGETGGDESSERAAYLSKSLFERLKDAGSARDSGRWRIVVNELDPALRYAVTGIMRDRAVMMLLEARVELADIKEAAHLLRTETEILDTYWFVNAGRAYDSMGEFFLAGKAFERAISIPSAFGREIEESAWLWRAEFLEKRLDASDPGLGRIVQDAWREYLEQVCANHPDGGPRCEHAYLLSGAR